jgi:hypothetical protein
MGGMTLQRMAWLHRMEDGCYTLLLTYVAEAAAHSQPMYCSPQGVVAAWSK